jgi:hypothetical protein
MCCAARTCAQVGVSNNPPGCVPFNLTAPANIPRCPQQCAVQGLAGAANRSDGAPCRRPAQVQGVFEQEGSGVWAGVASGGAGSSVGGGA